MGWLVRQIETSAWTAFTVYLFWIDKPGAWKWIFLGLTVLCEVGNEMTQKREDGEA